MTTRAAAAPVDKFLPELLWTSAATPVGHVVIVFSPEDQTVRASGVAVPVGDEPEVAAIGRLLESLMDRMEHIAPQTAAREMNPLPVTTGTVAEALADYAAGQVDALDSLTVEQPGTDFRHQVWEAMRQIRPGQPLTYGQLAGQAGRAAAVRAVGTACAQNLCAVVVPCHRVLRASGAASSTTLSAQQVGNYLYGPEAKAALLAFEAAHAGRLA